MRMIRSLLSLLSLLSILVAASLLTGCAGLTGAVNSSPSSISDRTVIDESAIVALSGVIEVAGDLTTAAVRSGIIKGDDLNTVKSASVRLRIVLQAAKSAYNAGNAPSYQAAASEIMATIGKLRTLSKGELEQ